MAGPNDKVAIKPDEVRAHGTHLDRDVTDRVRIAHEAAGVPMPPDAFGMFGFLATKCAETAAEGMAMLDAAHSCAQEQSVNVVRWATDVDAKEGEIAALFSTAPEMRDA